jgi:DNA-binding NarL/FixJ family response regulator
MAIRVLLVDDHQLVRQGLRAILDAEPDIKVVGEAADGAAAVTDALLLKPDVVVMDIAMPTLSGIESTRQILAKNAGARVLVLSMHGNRQIVMEALRAGAAGYLLKDCARDDLARAIRTVQGNLAFFSPQVADIVFTDYQQQDPAPESKLTQRERDVIALIGAGRSDVEAAKRLDLAARTVSAYRRQIMRKLGLHTPADLTKYAIRNGLCGLEQ